MPGTREGAFFCPEIRREHRGEGAMHSIDEIES
jgi:hypothetical protein